MVYPIFLIFIEIILFLSNYTPGTYLVGWDNLMPEFNFWLNLKRSLFSVWQEYRGLGLYDGMSHASNFFHTLYLLILSLFFPNNILRYLYLFLTHFLGGIGFYYLAKKILKSKKSAFLGALFYLFNLGVIQMYSAPLEVFATHFAALPFLSLTIINFLYIPNKKNLLFLFITSILTSPQTFVPTIFLVFLILLFFLLLFDYLKNKNITTVIIVFVVIIITNLFWFLPFFYGVKQNANIIKNTRINQYSSERIYLRNKAFGNLTNVFTFKGFMLDAVEFNNKNGKNEPLMTVWKDFVNKPLFIFIFGFLGILTMLGIINTIREKNSYLLPFLFTLATSLFFLGNKTIGLEQLNDIFRSKLPVLGEAFRFPFTKFITLFAFCYALFFAAGTTFFLKKFKKYQKVFFIILLLDIFFISFPALQGYFISPFMKQKIPEVYVKVFDYFNTLDESKRIAFLPSFSFWNWENRTWGHRGSGFLWYGIKQPILLRAFDPWSQFNEQFYNEFSYAQKKNDIDLFNRVLKKYNVDYLLVDNSIINNLGSKPINYDQIKNFLNHNHLLTLDKKFGLLTIYKVNQITHNQFISFIKNPIKTYPKKEYYYEDNSYKKYGEYIDDSKNPEKIEILPSLFTEKTQDDLKFNAQPEKNQIIFTPKNNLLKNLLEKNYYLLNVPNILNSYLIPAKIGKENNQLRIQIIQPFVVIDNNKYEPPAININIKTSLNNSTQFELTESNQIFFLGEYFYLIRDYPNTLKIIDNEGNIETVSIKINPFEKKPWQKIVQINSESKIEIHLPIIRSPFSFDNLINQNKWTINGKEKIITKNSIIIKTSKNKLDYAKYIDNLPHQSGYIIFATTNWRKGLPLNFHLDNPFQKRAEIEAILAKKTNLTNIIILPPTEKFFNGYGIHFVADPVAGETIETEITNLSLYPIPYEVLNQITLEKMNIENKNPGEKTIEFKVNKFQTFFYSLELSNLENAKNDWFIKLSQSYDPGWQAYLIKKNNWLAKIFPFLFGERLKDHVLVNNWANGWRLGGRKLNVESENILIIFWPQYLEFIGYGVMIVSFVFILSLQSKNKNPINQKPN